MPTLPPDRVHTPVTLHRDRQLAEAFGAEAERYDRARPGYPDALVDRIVAESPGPDVLDVGIGTGIQARQFRAAGCAVLGVDPDPRMAEVARRGGIEVEVGTFEGWDPAGRTFDAVVAAQAWHWVDPAAGAAKAARVLRPGGRLAVFWNVGQPAPDAVAAFAAVYARVLPGLPIYDPARTALEAYAAFFTDAADGMRSAGAFGRPEQWRYDWARTFTRDEWLDQVPTLGGHNRLPVATLEELLTGIGDAVDEVGGSVPMSYTTVAVTAVTGTPPTR